MEVDHALKTKHMENEFAKANKIAVYLLKHM